MAQIFKKRIFNEPNFAKIQNLENWIMGEKYFFSSPKNLKINYHFYKFGLTLKSNHYDKNLEDWKNFIHPSSIVFEKEINYEEFQAVKFGKDINNNIDWDLFDKSDEYFWRINEYVKANRANWAFYFLLGELQGYFNAESINSNILLEYINFMPEDFVFECKNDYIFCFNYFDERGYNISFEEGKFNLNKVGKGLYFE